jgi:hypothetical protein
MTDERESPGASGGFQPSATFLNDIIKAQGRAMSTVQNWSIDVMAAYRQQAEEYNGFLQAVNRSLQAAEESQRAMAELAESHAKAMKALSDSVDASRDLVNTAADSNRVSLERLESLMTDMVKEVGGQVAAFGNQMPAAESIAAGPLAAQNSAYMELTRNWMDAFNSLLGGGAAGGQGAEPEKKAD